MAATNYSPIQLYYSTTTTAAPAAGNLVSGELAINITDGILFYKDNAGAVQTLATKAGTSGSYSSITLTGGTANGVAYLNGSKVVTTGSALTFDGTNLKTTGSVLAGGAVPASGAGVTLAYNGSTTGYIYSYDWGASAYKVLNIAGGSIDLSAANNTQITFGVNGSEQMRLTSTGLGIGTSSFSYPLTVSRSTTGASAQFLNSSSYGQIFITSGGTNQNSYLTLNPSGTGNAVIQVGNVDRATIDSSGNLGLGVTPSAWGTAYKSVQVNTAGGFAAKNDGLVLAQNCYFDGTNWVNNRASTYTTKYDMNVAGNGVHAWYTYNGVFGTAGNAISFTQAMTLDASGRLIIGTTTANGLLTVSRAVSGATDYLTEQVSVVNTQAGAAGNQATIGFHLNNSNWGPNTTYARVSAVLENGTTGATSLVFGTAADGSATTAPERARIDSSGRFIMASASGSGLSGIISAGNNSGMTNTPHNAGIWGYASSTDSYPIGATGQSTNQGLVGFFDSTGAVVGSISKSSSSVAYNTTSDPRLKTLIGTITGAGERIDALQPVEFEWKTDGKRARGFFADKFQEVYPQSVTGTKDAVDENGNPVYQAMQASTSEVIADLVAEIQSLRQRLAQAGI